MTTGRARVTKPPENTCFTGVTVLLQISSLYCLVLLFNYYLLHLLKIQRNENIQLVNFEGEVLGREWRDVL
jgi:hypothetical protein